MDFFTKLNAVKISQLDSLCEEDKQAIMKIIADFEFRLKYLAKFEAVRVHAEQQMKKMQDEIETHFTELYFSVKCDSFGSVKTLPSFEDIDATTNSTYTRQKFNHNESVKTLYEDYVVKVIRYFTEKYKLTNLLKDANSSYVKESVALLCLKVQSTMGKNGLKPDYEKPDIEHIISTIRKMNGNRDFNEAEKHQIIKSFFTRFYKLLEHKGLNVFIYSIHANEYSQWNVKEIGATHYLEGGQKAALFDLLRFISLFEFDIAKNATGLQMTERHYDKFSFDIKDDIVLRNCKKAISLKLFKNGKVQIKFSDKESVYGFMDFIAKNNQ